MSYQTTGQANYVNVAVSPETGPANYQPIYASAPVTAVGVYTSMYAVISPELGQAVYGAMYAPEAVTGAAVYTAMNPVAPVTVVGGYNTPQS
jgi:hypothetical protein